MRVAVLSPAGPFFKNIVLAEAVRQGRISFENVEVSQPPSSPTTDLDLVLMAMVFADAGIGAMAGGYDAIVINAVPDYGLSALRSAVSIPVVGAGQAPIQVARGPGRRFSIMTIWPRSTELLYRRLLEESGAAASDCASVRYVHDAHEVSHSAARSKIHRAIGVGDQDLLARIEATCRQAIENAGADTVVLGCTCMSPLADELARRLPLPVLDPVRASFGFARLLLDSRLAHSPRAYPPATDDARRAVAASAGALRGRSKPGAESARCA